jgi:hypothetical protein
VWLPTAYVRAPIGLDYWVYLVALPIGLTAVLSGFFREVTVANLSDPSDDRSTGLKRWFLTASAVVTAIGLLLPWPASSERWVLALVALGASLLLSTFALFVLCNDPSGPSRRVLSLWDREGASPLRRFLGPGFAGTALLLVAVTVACQVVLSICGIAEARRSLHTTAEHAGDIAVLTAYASCFFGFLAGFAVFARSFEKTRFAPRALLSLALFIALAVPWFVVAIAGIASPSHDRSFRLAAPSPLYIFAIIEDLGGTASDHPALRAGVTAMVGWAAVGIVLGVAGARRLRRRARAEEQAWKALDVRLSEEDRRAAPLPAVSGGQAE